MKPCPFCFEDARIQRTRGALNEVLFTVGCGNEQCLAVGPIGRSEQEAVTKWDHRNMNITRGDRVTMAAVIGKAK
jgi:hypothetical protein